MSWFAKAVQSLRAMRHPTSTWSWSGATATLAHADRDYAREVGDGLSSSVVMAPLQWLQRTVPSAPLVVEERVERGRPLPDHPLAQLLQRPNPAYSAEHMLSATVLSLCLAGNAYWLKRRNAGGRVVELWYLPHWLVKPKSPVDGSAYLTHYEYRPGGELVTLEPADVVHIRHGIDPHDLRMGRAPLASVLREVWADMEISVFTAALLRNVGIPGLVISPDGPTAASSDDIAAVKTYLTEQFGGAKRGAPMVFSAKTKVDRLSWNPKELDLTAASDRAEERVCALLGVPPVVVGLHAGTSQTSVGATMREQVRIAWHSGVIPLQHVIATEVERSLLPDIDPQAKRRRVYFDVADVGALREDADAVAARAQRLMAAGAITVAECRQMLGIESDDTHEVYLRPMGVVEVPGSTNRAPQVLPPEPADPPRLAASSDRGEYKRLQPIDAKHTHSTFDTRLAATAPHAEPSDAQDRFIAALEAQRLRGTARWRRELSAWYRAFGDAAARVAEPILAEEVGKAAALEAKDVAMLDRMITDRVLEALDMPGYVAAYRGQYERHYLRVATDVKTAAAGAGMTALATDLPDSVARAVIATGGRRAGLVDLKEQARATVYAVLTQSRAEGLGVEAMVRRLRDDLPAGPWSSAEIRAEVIARTETKYAQNYSVVEHGRVNGVDRFLVYDARLGDTDEICMALDGAIVSAADAAELMGTEHPNGTRAFVPHIEDD